VYEPSPIYNEPQKTKIEINKNEVYDFDDRKHSNHSSNKKVKDKFANQTFVV